MSMAVTPDLLALAPSKSALSAALSALVPRASDAAPELPPLRGSQSARAAPVSSAPDDGPPQPQTHRPGSRSATQSPRPLRPRRTSGTDGWTAGPPRKMSIVALEGPARRRGSGTGGEGRRVSIHPELEAAFQNRRRQSMMAESMRRGSTAERRGSEFRGRRLTGPGSASGSRRGSAFVRGPNIPNPRIETLYSKLRSNLKQIVRKESLHVFSCYLPTSLLDKMNCGPPEDFPRQPFYDAIDDCVVMFSDVSGFTRMSERFASLGRIGSEKIKRMLDRTFHFVISQIKSFGGDVICFAGDGLVALWPSDGTTPSSVLVRRASECALQIQKGFAVGYMVPQGLRNSVTIAFGTVYTCMVGGLNGKFFFVVGGEPFAQLKNSSTQISPGEVVLSKEARALIVDGYAGAPLPSGDIILNKLFDLVGRDPAQVPFMAETHKDLMKQFISPVVLQRLSSNTVESNWAAELRTASVVFITLPDYKPNGDERHDQNMFEMLQSCVFVIQLHCNRCEGVMIKVINDDKGCIIILTFGILPSHDDDPLRAVSASLAIRRAIRDMKVSCAIGISTSNIFCGSYGSSDRKEYDILGDGVNLSARLMGSSTKFGLNNILCCERTFEAANNKVEFEPLLHPLVLKGKAKPTPAFLAIKETSHLFQRQGRHFVGRRRELTEFDTVLTNGGALYIEGDPGMGKSALVKEYMATAESRKVECFPSTCGSVHQQTPFFPFRSILQALYPTDERHDPTRLPDAVWEVLQYVPKYVRSLPLLQVVFPQAVFPDTRQIMSLSPEARYERTFEVVFYLLYSRLNDQRSVILLDDSQWIDAESVALVLRVVHTMPSAMIVMMSRPNPNKSALLRQFMGHQKVKRLKLEAMELNDLVNIAAQTLQVRTLPLPVIRKIRAKAMGNPYWCEELMLMWKNSGVLRVENGKVELTKNDIDDSEVPSSVNALIAARADQLPPSVQMTLKVASVVPSAFDADMLSAMYPIELQDDNQIHRDLGELVHLEYIEKVEAVTPQMERNPIYRFANSCLQVTVQNMLLYSQRKQLEQAFVGYATGNKNVNLALLRSLAPGAAGTIDVNALIAPSGPARGRSVGNLPEKPSALKRGDSSGASMRSMRVRSRGLFSTGSSGSVTKHASAVNTAVAANIMLASVSQGGKSPAATAAASAAAAAAGPSTGSSSGGLTIQVPTAIGGSGSGPSPKTPQRTRSKESSIQNMTSMLANLSMSELPADAPAPPKSPRAFGKTSSKELSAKLFRGSSKEIPVSLGKLGGFERSL